MTLLEHGAQIARLAVVDASPSGVQRNFEGAMGLLGENVNYLADLG
jgi:hypothetical protein